MMSGLIGPAGGWTVSTPDERGLHSMNYLSLVL